MSRNLSSFLENGVDLVLQHMHQATDRNQPVLEWHQPSEIYEIFSSLGCPLQLGDDEAPIDDAILLDMIRTVFRLQPNTSSPLFYNQLFAQPHPIGVLGSFIESVINTNMFTFEMAPVFTLMERELMVKYGRLIGGIYSDKIDGVFAPGGSMCNLYSVLVARHAIRPDTRQRGLQTGDRVLVGFTSEQSHYSITRAFSITGLGLDNIIMVKADASGRMDPNSLREKVEDALQVGKLPFYVNATMGTTVAGAIDPLPQISEICRQYSLWMHVDGAWGGSILLSKNHKHLASGIELADLVTWDPHKFLGVPLQCSLFLTKHIGAMESCNRSGACYLFQADKLNLDMDTGEKTIQCGRKVDCLKLYLMWRYLGDQGFQSRIDTCIDNAQYLISRINYFNEKNGSFVIVYQRHWSVVCFLWVPQSCRPLSVASLRTDTALYSRINRVCPGIKAEMQKRGYAMCNYQPLDFLPNVWRFVATNPLAKHEDLDVFLDQISLVGSELESKNLF